MSLISLSLESGTARDGEFASRTRTFATSLGILLFANAVDLLTTASFLSSGTAVEGNDISGLFGPSPKSIVENYGFLAVIPRKLILSFAVAGILLVARKLESSVLHEQELSIGATRLFALAQVALCLWNTQFLI